MAAFEPQPALFGDAELGLPVPTRAVEARVARGPGRPPGSRNKRAEDAAREVIERLGDPLVMLAAIAMTPVADLMAVGLSVAEALTEKRLSAQAVLPYLHQRKPLAVNVDGRQVVHLTIGGLAPGPSEGVAIDVAECVEIQAVSDVADGEVAQSWVAQSEQVVD